MRRTRTTVALVLGLIVLGTGPGASAASALTKTVVAGGLSRPPDGQLTFDAYYRRVVTVHVGDSVAWQLHGPHTITFLAGRRPSLDFSPVASDPVIGVTDFAGAPFWFNGQPTFEGNQPALFPAGGRSFDGTHYVNSGIAPPGGHSPPFKLRFPKAGTFRYVCLLHPGQVGFVRVLRRGRKLPSAAADLAAARVEYVKALGLAANLVKVVPAPLVVLAGNDGGRASSLRFFPATLNVHPGQTVTFKQNSKLEIHTVTLGPATYTKQIEDSFLTPRPSPAGPPKLIVNPLTIYPSDPLIGGALPSYDGKNHGNGFESSGLLSLDPRRGSPSTVTIKFTKPGTYRYECVVHQGMDGTIVVG